MDYGKRGREKRILANLAFREAILRAEERGARRVWRRLFLILVVLVVAGSLAAVYKEELIDAWSQLSQHFAR